MPVEGPISRKLHHAARDLAEQKLTGAVTHVLEQALPSLGPITLSVDDGFVKESVSELLRAVLGEPVALQTPGAQELKAAAHSFVDPTLAPAERRALLQKASGDALTDSVLAVLKDLVAIAPTGAFQKGGAALSKVVGDPEATKEIADKWYAMYLPSAGSVEEVGTSLESLRERLKDPAFRAQLHRALDVVRALGRLEAHHLENIAIDVGDGASPEKKAATRRALDGYRSFNQGFRWRTAPDEQGGPELRDPPHARAITPASADPLIPPIAPGAYTPPSRPREDGSRFLRVRPQVGRGPVSETRKGPCSGYPRAVCVCEGKAHAGGARLPLPRFSLNDEDGDARSGLGERIGAEVRHDARVHLAVGGGPARIDAGDVQQPRGQESEHARTLKRVRGLRSSRYVDRMSGLRTAFALVLAAVNAGCSFLTLGSTGERVLARCADPLGRTDASLVEPEGQWQDQFVVIRLHDPKSGAVVFTSSTIGFAAGRVEGLAWTSEGHVALVDHAGQPRVVYDVVGRSVVRSVEYGAPAPAELQITSRCGG